jgi:hypothetical protein
MLHENKSAPLRAIRLYNTTDGNCAFQSGTLPAGQHLPASYFFLQSHVDEYERRLHPAPRRQYVVTLQGRLIFKVSDGSTFTVAPGIILVAEDIAGSGHSWELTEGNAWLRIYIPIPESADSGFFPDTDV